ncbi:MAG TPA: ABC transporter permease [Acidimicrobiia bacterium]|nr:ABC transporter permease [Acidimicrobiia bacterium]
MNTLDGTGALARLILRLDRIRIPIWIFVLSILPISTASAFEGLYPTDESRAQFASTVSANPAFNALLGPLYDSSIGGLTAWRVGTLLALFLGIMAVLSVVRHTRDDEETGRRELLGSTVVGRHAPLAAALLVTSTIGLVIGSVVTLGLGGLGLPWAGSIAFGAAVFAVTLTFTAVGALAAQLTQAGSTARGLGIGLVGLFFLLRMAGDATDGLDWISWLSPIGWFTRIRPFAGEEWWVLALFAVFTAIVTGIAMVMSARRDVGEGAFPPRPGPARASRSFRSTSGLAWRLQRGSLLGWTIGLAVLGSVYGAAADAVGDILADNPQMASIFESLGGTQSLTDTFFSAAVGIIALVATAYSIRSVLKLRGEEDTLRAELVLATATPRTRHAWSHLAYGLLGPVVILATAGVVAGATYGSIVGDMSEQVPRVLGAAMSQLPAVWVVTGVTMTLYGLVPRLSSIAWGVLGVCVLFGQLGQILQLPEWLLDLSPFSHIPLVPAEDFTATPLIALVGIAVVFVVAGLVGFGRRDIPQS